MANATENEAFAVDVNNLPDNWLTHFHDDEFMAALGRTVATFGALEFALAMVIGGFSGTIKYDKNEISAVDEKWEKKLEKALSDPLGPLISTFEAEIKKHPMAARENPDDLIAALRDAADLRNVLCHGHWDKPDKDGKTIPSFYKMYRPEKKLQVFDIPIDIEYLKQKRKHVVRLIGAIMTTLARMGYQVPGTDSPGKRIF